MAKASTYSWIGLFIGFGLLVCLLIGGLFSARDWALQEVESGRADESWSEFRDALQEEQSEGSSVKRAQDRGETPPIQRVLIENFSYVVTWSVIFLTILYWSFGIMALTAFRTTTRFDHPPSMDDEQQATPETNT